MMTSLACAFATLGVHEGADVHVIRQAFKRAALKSHPDRTWPVNSTSAVVKHDVNVQRRFNDLCNAIFLIEAHQRGEPIIEQPIAVDNDELFFTHMTALTCSMLGNSNDQHSVDFESNDDSYCDGTVEFEEADCAALECIVSNRLLRGRPVPDEFKTQDLTVLRERLRESKKRDYVQCQRERALREENRLKAGGKVSQVKVQAKSKKQLRAEQRARDKELADIAVKLEEKSRAELDTRRLKEMAAAEKQEQREGEERRLLEGSVLETEESLVTVGPACVFGACTTSSNVIERKLSKKKRRKCRKEASNNVGTIIEANVNVSEDVGEIFDDVEAVPEGTTKTIIDVDEEADSSSLSIKPKVNYNLEQRDTAADAERLSMSKCIRNNDDWRCPLCMNINYQWRTQCNRCAESRPSGVGLFNIKTRDRSLAVQDTGNQTVSSNERRKEDDWSCSYCCNINFSWRIVCNRCTAPRPATLASPSFNPELYLMSNYKTKTCAYWVKGRCKQGDSCTFAHFNINHVKAQSKKLSPNVAEIPDAAIPVKIAEQLDTVMYRSSNKDSTINEVSNDPILSTEPHVAVSTTSSSTLFLGDIGKPRIPYSQTVMDSSEPTTPRSPTSPLLPGLSPTYADFVHPNLSLSSTNFSLTGPSTISETFSSGFENYNDATTHSVRGDFEKLTFDDYVAGNANGTNTHSDFSNCDFFRQNSSAFNLNQPFSSDVTQYPEKKKRSIPHDEPQQRIALHCEQPRYGSVFLDANSQSSRPYRLNNYGNDVNNNGDAGLFYHDPLQQHATIVPKQLQQQEQHQHQWYKQNYQNHRIESQSFFQVQQRQHQDQYEATVRSLTSMGFNATTVRRVVAMCPGISTADAVKQLSNIAHC